MWILLAFSSAVFAGLTAILAKIGLKDVNSTLATAMRTVVVLIFSLIIIFSTGAVWQIASLTLGTLFFLVLSGIATGASWICYFKALQMAEVHRVVPIDKSSTILSMVFGITLLGETENILVKIIGMALIAAGTILMVSQEKGQKEKPVEGAAKKRIADCWWVFAGLAAIFAALTSILGKIGIENVDSNLGTAVRTLVVLFMAWGIVFWQKRQGDIKTLSARAWVFIVLSGIATGGSWLCYYKALQAGQASVVVPIDKLSVILTICFSVVILKERVSKKTWLGLAVLTVGTLVLLVKF